MNLLAHFILVSAATHEASYNGRVYTLSLHEAVSQTVGSSASNKRWIQLTEMLLEAAWNDAIDWAKDIQKDQVQNNATSN